MTAKPRTKKIAAATAPATIVESAIKTGRFEPEVLIKSIIASPTNPRRTINRKNLEELAANIAQVGILEPLLVREAGEGFELICGERRWRASQIANLAAVPVIVKDLTDDQVLEVQIHENLHREDIHPMDEAYGYKFLQDKLGCDITELALRVGKSEGFVLNRLKLNTLIKEAQKDIDEGHLPLAYALEMAKYAPDAQQLIYTKVYVTNGEWKKNAYVYTPIKGRVISFGEFVSWIQTNILRLLSAAAFDKKAENLRTDGLACVKCPERTGANASLFEADQVGKKDSCLNPTCFESKLWQHVKNIRKDLAATAGLEINSIEFVRTGEYNNGKDYLGRSSFQEIGGKGYNSTKKTCDLMTTAISLDATTFGKTVDVCLAKTKCKIHHPNHSSSSSSSTKKSSKSEEQERLERLEEGRKRREEIWDSKIAEEVRRTVIVEASKVFAPKFTINAPIEGFLPELVKRFYDLHSATGMVRTLCTMAGIKEKERTDEQTAQILFFFIHCSKGEITYGNNWRSQKEVKKVAEDYSIDYQLIDAQERLKQSTKKAQPMHKAYLDAIVAGDRAAKIPRQFSEKYKTRD